MTSDLLIEILTEELPPSDLVANISEPFARNIQAGLAGFMTPSSTVDTFATPRRFGVVIHQINHTEPAQQVLQKGPAIANALDEAGTPTKALLGFMKSVQVQSIEALIKQDDGYFYAYKITTPKTLEQVLSTLILKTLSGLPISKNMRYDTNDYVFARPIHNIIILLGDKPLCSDTKIMGITPSNYTYGLRSMTDNQAILVSNAKMYEGIMLTQGKVIVNFSQRRNHIVNNLIQQADALKLVLYDNQELINTVTALTEFPVVLAGEFNANFLQVPQECLILSMSTHQKYFALLDAQGKLSNKFLFVANLASNSPQVVIHGNEKVLGARLNDAKFFYDTDLSHGLDQLNSRLQQVVYHNQLGTQADRIKRLTAIAHGISKLFNPNLDAYAVETTANLLKADLASEMVSEFPELQGVMGKYYALREKLPESVANAICEHYLPRFSGDELPKDPLSVTMALSDKLETLLGIWSIGLLPTGDKDPYALRRAAIGIGRILLMHPLDLKQLISIVANCLRDNKITITADIEFGVYNFVLQRLANYLTSTHGFSHNVVNATLHSKLYSYASSTPKVFNQLTSNLTIITEFAAKPEIATLLTANKRLDNILAKNATDAHNDGVNSSLLTEPAEIALYEYLACFTQYDITTQIDITDINITDVNTILINWHNYLNDLIQCGKYLDDFFTDIMVMCDDLIVRNNRLCLLKQTHQCFSYLCDLSMLSS